jgi:branched-chain amino acid transport system substrate-binding protein
VRRHARLAPVGALAVAAVLTAACGSSSKSSNATSPPTTAAAPGGATTVAAATTAAGAVTTAAAATGATTGAANASRAGETIKIGYANNEGGVFSLPEFRIGGEVAVDYINKNGGVNGAKIELVGCLADASPEGSINCANKFVEQKVAIAYTGIDVASDAQLPILSKAGIPFISSNSWGTAQRNDPNSFILHAAASAFTLAPLKTFKDLNLKKVAVLLEDTPAGQDFIKTVVKPIGEGKLGMQITAVTVDPANPDWNAAVTTAMASTPDAIWGQLTEPGCIGLVTATNALGYKGPVFAGSCSVYMQVLGAKSVGTYTSGDVYLPEAKSTAPANIQKNLDLYVANMKAAGQEKYTAFFELKSILETIKGPITADSVKAAFAASKDSPGYLGPDLHCASHPWTTEKSHCRADILVWKVVAGANGPIREPAYKDPQNYLSLVS